MDISDRKNILKIAITISFVESLIDNPLLKF
jgi:hypothetical protein